MQTRAFSVVIEWHVSASLEEMKTLVDDFWAALVHRDEDGMELSLPPSTHSDVRFFKKLAFEFQMDWSFTN